MVIDGTSKNDTLIGGNEHDFISAYEGNDSLIGNDGDDALFGDNGNDILNGGFGDDNMYGGFGNDTLIGGGGNDRIVDAQGANLYVFDPGHGKDFIHSNVIWSGSVETIDFPTFINKIDLSGFGTDAPTWDEIQGNMVSFSDYQGGIRTDISREEANQRFGIDVTNPNLFHPEDYGTVIDLRDFGGGVIVLMNTYKYEITESDFIGLSMDSGTTDPTPTPEPPTGPVIGTSSPDQLRGTSDDNVLQGFAGDDILWGLQGNDQLHGGSGADILLGGPGSDSIEGGEGDDRAWGEDGDDWINDTAGNDFLAGGAGNDRIAGGEGTDYLMGESGNDTIIGGAGYDNLVGGTGNDRLIGANEGDTFFGQEGGDRFVIAGGVSWIMDFNPADGDRIEGLDWRGTSEQVGLHLRVDLADDAVVWLAWTLDEPVDSWFV